MNRCPWCAGWHTERTILCADCEARGQSLNDAKGGKPSDRLPPFVAFPTPELPRSS